MASFCAYQDRSLKQVQEKIDTFDISSADKDQIIDALKNENFIDESRFALAFAGGKFRLKKWGKIKITVGLKQHNVPDNIIKMALNSLDQNTYLETLEFLINQKSQTVTGSNEFEKKQKIARYAISKGYEPELVWNILKLNPS